MLTDIQQIHCASWPSFPSGLPHHSLSLTANYASCMTYAIETGTFVIVSSANLTQANLDVICGDDNDAKAVLGLGNGLAEIFDPEGNPIGNRPSHDVQALCIGEVDLELCMTAKSVLDPVGHYSRHDIFQVSFDNRPRQAIITGDHAKTPSIQSQRRSRVEVFDVYE
jgi:nitrilase